MERNAPSVDAIPSLPECSCEVGIVKHPLQTIGHDVYDRLKKQDEGNIGPSSRYLRQDAYKSCQQDS
jgi:hypothetical protein